MKKLITSLLTTAAFASVAEAVVSVDTPTVIDDSTAAILTDVRCADVKVQSLTEIACFLSFPDSVPNFFFEVDSSTNQVVIKLLNTKVGGILVSGKIDTVNLGPVTTVQTVQQIHNKNEAVKLLTPEWYSVVLVTINCSPMLRRQKDLVVSQLENAISISFPWPDEPKKRKKYYTFVKKQRRPGLVLSLIGIGVAGIGAGGYLAYRRYYRPDDTPGELEPVLPEHPSAP